MFFQLPLLLQRVAAMHQNDILNPKASFETLCNTNLNDIIVFQGWEHELKSLMSQVKVKGINLF